MIALAIISLSLAVLVTWLFEKPRFRDTNGNDPRYSQSFEEWWDGWQPSLPEVITNDEGKAYSFKEIVKLAYIASAGQWEFTDLQERQQALRDEGDDE